MDKDKHIYEKPWPGDEVIIFADPCTCKVRLDRAKLVRRIAECHVENDEYHYECWDIIPTETSLQTALIKVRNVKEGDFRLDPSMGEDRSIDCQA